MSASHYKDAEKYVAGVISGKIPACKWVKLACKRHVSDLERAKTKAFRWKFNVKQAERICNFAEMMPHVKGKWARKDPKTGEAKKLKLEPWQKFALCSLFGWVDKKTGFRRFTKCSFYIPRKNAKSTLASVIGWWFFIKDGEPGAEVYSGATSEKQAWEVFGPARRMAILEPDLVHELGVTVAARSLQAPDGSKFEPIIGKPGDGASPHCAIIDEYHEHPTSELRDTMETGMGAREQPLSLIISTAGSNLAGPCREDWKNCETMLEGTEGFVDETHLAIIWTIDDDDDWTTEAALAKANPNWGVSVNPDVILPALAVARRDPRKQSAYLTKHLNKWVAARNAFFNIEEWNRLADPKIKPADFSEYPCILAADFASKHDLVALMQLFILPEKRYAIFGKYYLPETTINLPENQHYRTWKRGGWITETPGDITDLSFILEDAAQMVRDFQVEEMPSDPNRAWGIFPQMQAAGIPVVEYRNTVLTMSEPMKQLDAMIRAKTITHNGDPVLSWAVSNVTAKEDKKENVYPNKEDNRSKIDPVVASLFAIGRAMTRPEEGVASHGFSFV